MKNYSPIADFETYNARMGKGLIDKLFFVDKIDPDFVLDFGCADGSLLKVLRTWYPNAKLVGYDIDPKMVELANKERDENLNFTSDWEQVSSYLSSFKEKTSAILLSSIVHEVYHYQEPSEVDAFWSKVFSGDFNFVVFRDMIPGRSINRHSDIDDVTKIYRNFLHTKQLQDFENIWGSIEDNRSLTHFLLKYKYETPNWEREVKENYLPLYREDLLAMIPMGYDVIYHEHFVLPYIKRTVKQEVGIEMKDPTHLKLILEKA